MLELQTAALCYCIYRKWCGGCSCSTLSEICSRCDFKLNIERELGRISIDEKREKFSNEKSGAGVKSHREVGELVAWKILIFAPLPLPALRSRSLQSHIKCLLNFVLMIAFVFSFSGSLSSVLGVILIRICFQIENKVADQQIPSTMQMCSRQVEGDDRIKSNFRLCISNSPT